MAVIPSAKSNTNNSGCAVKMQLINMMIKL